MQTLLCLFVQYFLPHFSQVVFQSISFLFSAWREVFVELGKLMAFWWQSDSQERHPFTQFRGSVT
jgi:hypothetical protein